MTGWISGVTEKGTRLPDWGRLSVRRLTVAISLGLIMLAGLALFLLSQGIERQIDDVTATYAVRNEASLLTNALIQAESNQRGYLLTQDRQFLVPYKEGMDRIDDHVEALLEMTSDDEEQSERVKGITDEIADKMAEMEQAITLVDEQRGQEAQTLTQTGMGARLMTEVRETLVHFLAEENEELVGRNEAIFHTRQMITVALLAALGAAAILIYALLSRTQREVSVLAERQQGLVTQNEALESEVAERTKAIEEARGRAERERRRVETLLKDTNHRIGNSLATVSSLLALQLMRTRSQEVRIALEAARLRVHAIASAHRRLRLGGDLESASAREFLGAVIDDIITTQTEAGRIAIDADIEKINISARDATTIGILVGELVTNALKHAFPENRFGNIAVALFRDHGGVPVLRVADDGIGLQPAQGEGGLGSVIICQLAGQFGGTPVYGVSETGGVVVTVALPELHKPPESLDAPHAEGF